MKNIISIFFFLSMLGIALGFYYKSGDELLGNKIIGASVSFMVFVFMPLFIYHRYKNKNINDYVFDLNKFKKKVGFDN